RDPREPLPVLVNLASLGEYAGAIESWLSGEVFARYGLPEIETHNRLRAEAWVLLLDGLDEVAPPARGRAIRMLNELRERHPVPIVVGSREVEYAASDARIECRGAVRISPIDAERRLHILEALGPATESFAR